MDNISHFTGFTLSQLEESMSVRQTCLALSLAVYLLIIILNLILILTILLEKSLHEPMYIFVCSLCINGLFGTTGFYPKFLYDLISDTHVISFGGCSLQFFVIYTSAMCEFTTLSVMSYDRYVAICRPLDYHSVMTNKTVGKLLMFSWLLPALSSTIVLLLTNQLSLCGSHIDKLYCDNWSIVKLSCEPTITYNIYGGIGTIAYVSLVILIIWSYGKLIIACVKSTENKSKFMHTCVPHLLSLINFTIALLFDVIYGRYGSKDFPQSLRNFMSLEFLLIPPVFNPLIYGLKLTVVRKRAFRAVSSVKGRDLFSISDNKLKRCCYIIDDLLAWGDSPKQHDHRLVKLLERVRENNLKLNRNKCKIRMTEIKYIGHILSANGFKLDKEKQLPGCRSAARIHIHDPTVSCPEHSPLVMENLRKPGVGGCRMCWPEGERADADEAGV
ncbi:olfactory receptor 142-like [Megalops cyprinoides]|uniref:olfactory receptor 142-like n=1 Tax=Megalops cyprinoides TaxID=118141 RepID=UPI0018649B32|nr:olfactory receptor 142-like [Megalops cyprinoides]